MQEFVRAKSPDPPDARARSEVCFQAYRAALHLDWLSVNIAVTKRCHLKSLSDPTRLKPINKKDGLLQVIVETPAGSRNKFAFDPDQSVFALKNVLPAGMVFPYDFGFLPHTLAPDGDPIDVLLLMDEPAFPGCAVKARLIGVIEGEQSQRHLNATASPLDALALDAQGGRKQKR